jgi:hypothetical protein
MRLARVQVLLLLLLHRQVMAAPVAAELAEEGSQGVAAVLQQMAALAMAGLC